MNTLRANAALKVPQRWQVIATLLLVATSLAVQAADGDTSCVSTKRSAPDRHEVKNQCAGPMSVAYCRADKPIFGRRCGQQESKDQHQPYYTHLRVLKPGESMVSFGDIRTAVCAGEIAAAAGTAGSLDSRPDGSYTCWPKQAAKAPSTPASKGADAPANSQTTTLTATGTDLAETCKLAQTSPSESLSNPSPCTCGPLHSSAQTVVYRCTATFTGTLPQSLIPQIKGQLREHLETEAQKACAQRPDDAQCKPKPAANGGPGVRG